MVALEVKDHIILVCLYNYRLLIQIHLFRAFLKYRNKETCWTCGAIQATALNNLLRNLRAVALGVWFLPWRAEWWEQVGLQSAGSNLWQDSHREPRELHAPEWRLLNLIELHYQQQNLTHIQRTAHCPKIATSQSWAYLSNILPSKCNFPSWPFSF